MKYLKSPGLCLLFMFFYTAIAAQGQVRVNEPDMNKPALFDNLPNEIPLEIAEINNLITGNNESTGKEVQLRSASSKLTAFKGRIVSAASKYNNKMKSIVIRSNEFNGATMTLSSSVDTDGSMHYTGRIISFQHRDLYVLEKKDDQYVFVKKNFYDLVNE